MAFDEFLFRRSELCLRVYPSIIPGVIVGRFQDLNEEVNLDNCLKDGIELVRRISGGGSVYKTPNGEYNYTLVVPLGRFPFLRDVNRAYTWVLEALSSVVNKLWRVKSYVYPGSTDLVVANRKISGNAMARSKDVVMIHGTLLVSIEKDVMFKYIRTPPWKFRKRGFLKQEDYVTDLFSLTGIAIPVDVFASQLEKFLSNSLGVESCSARLSSDDLKAIESLCAEKYEKITWLIKKRAGDPHFARCDI